VIPVARRWGAKGVRDVAVAGALLSAATCVTLAARGADAARLYYGTDTRAQAILIGAAVAAIFAVGRETATERVLPRGLPPLAVHLKVDTGMHRVGADVEDAPALAGTIAADPGLELGAVWTHLAVADGEGPDDREYTRAQLQRFDALLAGLAAAGHRPGLTHVANSAGTIAVPEARRDLVRCGIALYGVAPTEALGGRLASATGGGRLRPVLALRTRVTFVRDLDQGERPSYGRRRPLARRSTVATAPVGYADGVPRRLFDQGGEVLIRGIRRPLAGVVTMDQIVIDCGPVGADPVAVGDEVVLLGRQGSEEVLASEWADLLGTISYEVLCDIGPRVPRLLTDDRAGSPD